MRLADRVKQAITVEGNAEANATLGAAAAHYAGVASRYADNESFIGLLEADTGEWETSVCQYNALANSVTRSPIESSAGIGVGAVFPAGGSKTLTVVASANAWGAVMDAATVGDARVTWPAPDVDPHAVQAVALGRGSMVMSYAWQALAMLGAAASGACVVAVGPSSVCVDGFEVRGMFDDAVFPAGPLRYRGEMGVQTVDATPTLLRGPGGSPQGSDWSDPSWTNLNGSNAVALVLEARVVAVVAPGVDGDAPTCAVWTVRAVYVGGSSVGYALAGPASVVPIVNTTGSTLQIDAATDGPGLIATGAVSASVRWGATVDIGAVRFAS